MPREGGAFSNLSRLGHRLSSRRTGSSAFADDDEIHSIELRFHAALDARAGHHRLVPALDIGEIRKLHLVAWMPPGPAEERKVGDRYSARNKVAIAQPAIKDAIEAPRLRHAKGPA